MKIVNRTLEEADRCRRAGIPITTFMLAPDPMLVNFVEQLSQINRGRAFYSSPDRLGEYILADYIRNRRKFVRWGRGPPARSRRASRPATTRRRANVPRYTSDT